MAHLRKKETHFSKDKALVLAKIGSCGIKARKHEHTATMHTQVAGHLELESPERSKSYSVSVRRIALLKLPLSNNESKHRHGVADLSGAWGRMPGTKISPEPRRDAGGVPGFLPLAALAISWALKAT